MYISLNRRIREKAFTQLDYKRARKQLLADVQDADVLQITPSVIARSVTLLETNVLRGMDSLHVACALEWKADLFVTSDRRQFNAAANSGLPCKYIDS